MLPTLPLYRANALRAMEAHASAALGGDAMRLMQRAGQAAWRELLAHWPRALRLAVSCGPGNNGGDGYVLALHALQSGRDVQVVHPPGHAPRSALARRAHADFVAAGGRVSVFDGGLPTTDLLVDALFGIGLDRAPDAGCAGLIDAVNTSGQPVLALDVPSGLDADTGHVPGAVVIAHRTLEFIARHVGNRTGAAADCVGTLALASLDVAPDDITASSPDAGWLQPDALAALRPRSRIAHKGRHGHVLCIGGDHGFGGAILLCAEATLRAGAGLASVVTRTAHVGPLLARRPECMALAADDAEALPPLPARVDVLAVGPGLGRGRWGRALFGQALAAGRPLVVDADALNLLAEDEGTLPGSDCVLTPHPGEAARLLAGGGEGDVAGIERDRLGAAQALASRFDCTVVLKGAGSVIASPGRLPVLIGAGNPGMAVGGMGDVLTGVIASLRAQGHAPPEAAALGALLHAAAADLAAGDGERGLLPADLLPALRRLANPACDGREVA
ncbi:MAG: NAD(P)H-hydrate dehydratase [Pseudoxanthomonas suwonensis]|nr:NAD(P)H-hydrate dehydratase [Pseudoxanthomonas suwonensis]